MAKADYLVAKVYKAFRKAQTQAFGPTKAWEVPFEALPQDWKTFFEAMASNLYENHGIKPDRRDAKSPPDSGNVRFGSLSNVPR